MIEIARIESQCSKCSLEDRNYNFIRKSWKYLHFLCCENEKNLCSSQLCSNFIQKFSNNLKYLPEVSVGSRFSSIMLGFARKMLGFARNFFQKLCSRSLGDRSRFSYARNARQLFCSRSLGSKIQNQKLCSRSLGSKISMLEMLEIDVFAARSQLYATPQLSSQWGVWLSVKVNVCNFQGIYHHNSWWFMAFRCKMLICQQLFHLQ